MSQHVKVVKRPKSNSCLDNVYSTHGHFLSDIIVPIIGLADQLPTFCCHRYFKQGKVFAHNVINYADFKNLNTEALLSDLRDSPWDSAFVFDDLDDVLDTLELMPGETVKRHFPKKQKRVNQQKQPEWMNEQSFYLTYGKHWSRRLQSVRIRPPKGNIHTVISFFRITTGANIFETLHLQLKYIAYTDTY